MTDGSLRSDLPISFLFGFTVHFLFMLAGFDMLDRTFSNENVASLFFIVLIY